MRKSRRRSLYSRMANRSYGSTFCTISATLASSWSRSRVNVMVAETSSRKSSSSLRSRNRTAALRVLCMALSTVRRSGSGGLDNLDAGAGADPGGAGGGHGLDVLEGANAATGFHPDVGTHRGAHQSDVVDGGAGGGKAGRSLDEIGARRLTNLAGDGLLIVVEERGLQNHFDDCAGLVSHPHDALNIVPDGIGIARTQRAHVDHHVDFLRPGAQRSGGFAHLGVGAGGAQRETYHAAHLHRGTGEFRLDQRHPVGIHADAGKAVLARFAADFDHVVAGGFGLEDGVIDERRNAGVDASQFFAGGYPRGAGGDDLLGVPRAGLHAALHAAGTHLVGQVEPFALLLSYAGHHTAGSHTRQQFFTDLGNEEVEFRMRHVDAFPAYSRSMSIIFWTRAW